MRTNFTFIKKQVQGWYLLFILLFVATLPTDAQTKHIVEAKDFVFVPDTIHIHVGDTVEWRNVEGNHNVNGMWHTYPSNPAQFGNNLGIGWTYSYVFELAGTYDYHCDKHVIDGMRGKVIVEEPTVATDNKLARIKMYPNPAGEKVWIDAGNRDPRQYSVRMYDISGELKEVEYKIQTYKIELHLGNLPQGIYLVEIHSSSDKNLLKLIKK